MISHSALHINPQCGWLMPFSRHMTLISLIWKPCFFSILMVENFFSLCVIFNIASDSNQPPEPTHHKETYLSWIYSRVGLHSSAVQVKTMWKLQCDTWISFFVHNCNSKWRFWSSFHIHFSLGQYYIYIEANDQWWNYLIWMCLSWHMPLNRMTCSSFEVFVTLGAAQGAVGREVSG